MKQKLFILHEIYGVNDFIKEQSTTYSSANTEVECISFYPDGTIFPYDQEKEAYNYFSSTVGFDTPISELTHLLLEATKKYEEVVVIGFSVGATIAWRLSTLPLHQVVCIYGSRIRQYLDVQPNCPTLVILPTHEKSFDVNDMKQSLHFKPFVQTAQFLGEHGFMDFNNPNYNKSSCKKAHSTIMHFLQNSKSSGGHRNGPKY